MDGQLSIFDILETPKAKNGVKVGEVIYFVGFRAWVYDNTYRTMGSVYKLTVKKIYENGDFLAALGNYEIILNADDYRKRFWYLRAEADKFFKDDFYARDPKDEVDKYILKDKENLKL